MSDKTTDKIIDNVPKEDTPITEKGKKMVQIDEETLKGVANIVKSLQDDIKSLREESEKKSKEIDMLKSVADKGRMFKYEVDNAKGGQIIREAKIGTWEDKPIVAWTSITDEVGFREGRMIVNQRIRIFVLPDGVDKPEPIELDYLFWAQNTRTLIGQVVSTSNDNTGEYWTLELKDGRKVTLDIRFINPF